MQEQTALHISNMVHLNSGSSDLKVVGIKGDEVEVEWDVESGELERMTLPAVCFHPSESSVCVRYILPISNLVNVAISLFFASLADVTSHADLLMRGPRNFSRLEGIAIVCFEGVNGDSNIPFAIRKAGWRGEGLGVRAREGRSGPITHTVVLRQAVVGFALVG
jgi:hypothetical protein